MSESGLNALIYPVPLRSRPGANITSPIQIIKVLMANGVMANINQQIDFDTAAVVLSNWV